MRNYALLKIIKNLLEVKTTQKLCKYDNEIKICKKSSQQHKYVYLLRLTRYILFYGNQVCSNNALFKKVVS